MDIRPSGAKFELEREFSNKTRVNTQENQESKVNNKPLVNQTPLHKDPENITDNQETMDIPKEMVEAKEPEKRPQRNRKPPGRLQDYQVYYV